MPLRRALVALLPLLVVSASAVISRAGTLAENLVESGGLTAAIYGQSVTTSPGGPFDHIVFNFFDNHGPAAPGGPHADGTAYLFSQAYTGTPANLSVNPGSNFIASAAASGGFFTFNPSVTLQGNTQYFIYTDTVQNSLFIDTLHSYAGGTIYALSGGNFTADSSFDLAFRLTGTPAVPLPTALSAGVVSLPLLLLSLALHRRKLRAC